MSERPVGCLTMILRLFGINLAEMAERDAEGHELPYRLRDDFLSPAELSFYHVLRQAVGGDATILAKVNLADLLFVPGKAGVAHRNKIDRKHVDFVLCDPTTMRPQCAVELDDSSHRRADRQERDKFVDAAFGSAGLRLVRVAASRGYSPAELRQLLSGVAVAKRASHSPTSTPMCPKCNVPMIERKATRGANAGKLFWGCGNYPKCREVCDGVR